MTKTVTGRTSIFPGKVNDSDHRVQAWLTHGGRERFELARAHLADMARKHLRRPPSSISDADTIEYLTLGELDTIKHLRKLRTDERADEVGT